MRGEVCNFAQLPCGHPCDLGEASYPELEVYIPIIMFQMSVLQASLRKNGTAFAIKENIEGQGSHRHETVVPAAFFIAAIVVITTHLPRS